MSDKFNISVVIGEDAVAMVDDYLYERLTTPTEQPYISPEIQDIQLVHREFNTKAELDAYCAGYVDSGATARYTFLFPDDLERINVEINRRRATVMVSGGAVEIDYDTGAVLWPDVDINDDASVWSVKLFDIPGYVGAGGIKKAHYSRDELVALMEVI